MSMRAQVERLVAAGVPDVAGVSADEFRELAADLTGEGVLCVHPELAGPSQLAPLLRRGDRPGFVVADMDDLDAFDPIESVVVPDRALYLVHGVDRGDDLLGWTPDRALPEILARGRSPLTIGEGISWLLQAPEVLEPTRCFMCIGSRKRKARGLDARTPAIWISRGTGRDGADRRDAPKVGWCWAGNHHTWLGFASALSRS